MTFATSNLLPLWIILGCLGFFGLLILIIIAVKKKFSSLQIKKDDEISEEQAIQQELDRILVPVDDLQEKPQEEKVEDVKKD